MKMPTEFENKVADFAQANGLFSSTAKVLLAASGGADSTALMYAMQSLKSKNVLGAELLCAHINHQLRGAEADKDEDFVMAEAAKLKLAVRTKRVDVRGYARRNRLSIETAARKLRIESLLDIAKANDCQVIATAHQKNDNAETVLQRLVRGTGFRGLGGIWPKRAFAGNISFIRPLLCVSRDEIIKYLKKQNLKWRDDHTNVDCSYRRNFIRHRLIPALQQQCRSSLVEQLFDLSQTAQRFYSLVCSKADEIWTETAEVSGETAVLNLKSFLAQPQAVKVELVQRSLIAVGSGERNLTHRHYERILQLAEKNIGGKKVELPNGFVVCRGYNNLIFNQPRMSVRRTPYGEAENLSSVPCLPCVAIRAKQGLLSSVILDVPGQTQFGQHLINATIFDAGLGKGLTAESTEDAEKKIKFRKSSAISAGSAVKGCYVEWFDLDRVKLPLIVRPRKAGDRFVPLGLREEKKIGKFLTATKVQEDVRKEVLIVADSEKIIWVWPVRISEQVKITGETKGILQLQIGNINPAQQLNKKNG